MLHPPRFKSRRTLAPQAPPPGLYASTYRPERGAAICARLAAGESLRSICRRDPSMPTEKTVWNWARAHEDFRLMKRHAQSTARARSLAERDARDAARRAAAPFGGPKGRTGRPSGYSPELTDAIMTRVMMGEGLEAVCRDPAMPSVGAVYGWMRRRPELLADYRRSKAWVEEVLIEQACADLPWLGERKSWPMLRRVVRAAETAARRLSLKRYAPPAGPSELTVRLEAADGTSQVIYRG
jgi:hypothetical protein